MVAMPRAFLVNIVLPALIVAAIGAVTVPRIVARAGEEKALTPAELELAKSLTLAALPALPPDPSNRVGDDPKAAELGRELFFDTRLSANAQIACASCHQPGAQFQDGLPLAQALSRNFRRTMPLAGSQWGVWFFWDGRKDSQWSQALGPLENPVEHGITRADVVKRVLTHHGEAYADVFGERPDFADWPNNASPLVAGKPLENWQATPDSLQFAIDHAFANIGKAIAAFERTLMPQENRFDRFVAAALKDETPAPEDELSEDELAGFRLFVGKGGCNHCHSGALLTDDFFHNTGVPFSPDVGGTDWGRAAVVEWLANDTFSCLGPHSDAPEESCRELRFMSKDQKLFEGAFKTPTLRGVADRPPYMHAGQIETLEQVVDHYDKAPDPFFDLPDINGEIIPHGRHSEVMPLDLSEKEKAQLLDFLKLL